MLKKILKLVTALLLIFILGEVALLIAGLVPQEPVKESIEASMPELQQECESPYILHDRSRNGIDNFTDCLMLNLSYYSNTKSDPLAILSNPYNWGKDQQAYLNLANAMQGQDATGNYVNYCMGYRIWLRPLLSVFNYMEIRTMLQSVLWVLFGFSILCVYHVTKDGFFCTLYILSVASLNLIGISSALTYMQCFIIAFLGILLVPKILAMSLSNSIWLSMFFLLLGAVTQFLDFYTYPLITFALPMIVLLYGKFSGQGPFTVKDSFRVFLIGLLAWMSAYIGIWLLKLLFTAIFTKLDVLAVTNRVLNESLGILPNAAEISKTLLECWKNIVTPEIGIALLIVLAVGTVRFIRNPAKIQNLQRSWVFLAVGALGVIWILLTKRTIEHMTFQYRTLGVLLFGMLAFLANASRKKAAQKPD